MVYLIKNRVVDNSNDRGFVDDESNRNTHERESVDEVCCAVQRVDHPSGCICQQWDSMKGRRLLSYKLDMET